MNDRDFIYWLQGYFELTLNGPAMLPNPEKGFGYTKYPPLGYQQWCSIRNHVKLVISERKQFTKLSSVVDQIAGLVEDWESYRADRLDRIYEKIRNLVKETMVKVTPEIEYQTFTTNLFNCSSIDPVGNVCFESAEKYFQNQNIYNAPAGAGIMTC